MTRSANAAARAVDDSVVERDGDVADAARDNVAPPHDRALGDAVDAEDRDFGMVDQWGDEKAAQLACALVTVKVEPRSSSRVSVPARADAASRSTSAASSSSEAVSRRGRRARRDPHPSGRPPRGRTDRDRRLRRLRVSR